MLEPLVTPQTLEKHPVSELQELCQRMRKRVEYKYHTSKLSDDEEEMKVVEVSINMKSLEEVYVQKKKWQREGLQEVLLNVLKSREKKVQIKLNRVVLPSQ